MFRERERERERERCGLGITYITLRFHTTSFALSLLSLLSLSFSLFFLSLFSLCFFFYLVQASRPPPTKPIWFRPTTGHYYIWSPRGPISADLACPRRRGSSPSFFFILLCFIILFYFIYFCFLAWRPPSGDGGLLLVAGRLRFLANLGAISEGRGDRMEGLQGRRRWEEISSR